jgi:hypothetical protein
MNHEDRLQASDKLILSLNKQLNAENAENSALKLKLSDKRENQILAWTLAAFFSVTSILFGIALDKSKNDFDKLNNLKISEIDQKSKTLEFIAIADSVFEETKLLYPTDTLFMTAQGRSGEIFKIIVVDCYWCK